MNPTGPRLRIRANGYDLAEDAVARGVSTWGSGGVANPVLSTAEAAGSTAVSVAAVLAPFLALLAVALLVALWAQSRRDPRAALVRERP